MSGIKIVVVGLAALGAIDAALAAAVNSGKRKVEVDGRPVVAITQLGTSKYVITTNDAVLTAGADAAIVSHLTDPDADITGLKLAEVGKVEVQAAAFDLATYDPALHDVFTRSGNRVIDIRDAGSKAPAFGRVIFIQNHANGYLLNGRCSSAGRVSDKHEHTQDLLIVPKGSVTVDIPAAAVTAEAVPAVEGIDENPLG